MAMSLLVNAAKGVVAGNATGQPENHGGRQ